MIRIDRVAQPVALACMALLLSACSTASDAGDLSPAPLPSPSTASSPEPSPTELPLLGQPHGETLTSGTYFLEYFPVRLTFDIPEGDGPGWHVGKSSPYAVVVLWNVPPDVTYGFAIWAVDNLYVDPCDAAAGRLDPPIGPSVDDLVSALSTQSGFEATSSVDVSVGAFRGKRIELSALDPGSCPAAIPFRTGYEVTDMSPGETRQMDILDVDGVRVVLNILDQPEQPDATAAAQLRQILDSIRTE